MYVFKGWGWAPLAWGGWRGGVAGMGLSVVTFDKNKGPHPLCDL